MTPPYIIHTILLRKHSQFCYKVAPSPENICSIPPEISQKYSLPFFLLNSHNQRQFHFPLFASSFCRRFSRELFTFNSLTFCRLSALSFSTSITRLFSITPFCHKTFSDNILTPLFRFLSFALELHSLSKSFADKLQSNSKPI